MNVKHLAMAAAIAAITPVPLGAVPSTAAEQAGTASTVTDRPAADVERSAEEAEPPSSAHPPAEAPPVTEPPAVTPTPPPSALAPSPPPAQKKDSPAAQAPILGLGGIPDAFEAGGDWSEFSATVDHSNGTEAERYFLVLVIGSNGQVTEQDIQLQAFLQGAWHDVSFPAVGPGEPTAVITQDLALSTNLHTIPLRAKFSAQTPLTDVYFTLAGRSILHDDVESDSAFAESTIIALPEGGEDPGNGEDPGQGEDPGRGEHPGQGGTSDPGQGPDSGTNPPNRHDDGGTVAPVNAPGSTGHLAETGADSHGTARLLGIAGLLAAAGGGLIIGTGKRRRPRNKPAR
ncbi:hypothetical protein ACFV0B_35895 [Streptomyces xanthophaeus]|uniref:hypothetical protein n=1 Tax=Streptomyces xanthophaeus TaxID=67385 RepID=UPI00368CF1BB